MDTSSTRRIAAVVAVTAALGAYTWVIRSRTVPPEGSPRFDRIPAEIAGYTAREEYIPPLSVVELGADTMLARTYADGAGGEIELFIGYFATQQERSQIHSPKHCYPGSGWDILAEGSLPLHLAGRTGRARRLTISDGVERRLVVYWFTMRGRMIPDEFALKWNQMKNALLGRPQSAAFIRFSVPLPPGEEDETGRRLSAFIEQIAPGVIETFAQPSGGGREG